MTFKQICLFLILLFGGQSLAHADTAADLFSRVEQLNIARNGYVLGAVLDKTQKKRAAENPLPAPGPGTYKFSDQGLHVVADAVTNRVLVMYEQFEAATQQSARDLAGTLFMDFEEPTVSAHDKLVYWAYAKEGKISSEAFDRAKEGKRKLDIIATIKLSSELKILEKKEQGQGFVYYIISSPPLLRAMGANP